MINANAKMDRAAAIKTTTTQKSIFDSEYDAYL